MYDVFFRGETFGTACWPHQKVLVLVFDTVFITSFFSFRFLVCIGIAYSAQDSEFVSLHISWATVGHSLDKWAHFRLCILQSSLLLTRHSFFRFPLLSIDFVYLLFCSGCLCVCGYFRFFLCFCVHNFLVQNGLFLIEWIVSRVCLSFLAPEIAITRISWLVLTLRNCTVQD